jgi:hypothetical protein
VGEGVDEGVAVGVAVDVGVAVGVAVGVGLPCITSTESEKIPVRQTVLIGRNVAVWTTLSEIVCVRVSVVPV